MTFLGVAMGTLAISILAGNASSAPSGEASGRRNVLILNGADANLPAFIAVDRGLRDAIVSTRGDVTFFSEALDLLRFPEEQIGPQLSELLRQKYAGINVGPRLLSALLVPGMAHCGGGDGPNAFGNGADAPVIDADHDLLKALERWVEQGVAPDQIIATYYSNNDAASGIQFQRPLCPLPQVPRLIANGDPADANSFKCARDLPQ